MLPPMVLLPVIGENSPTLFSSPITVSTDLSTTGDSDVPRLTSWPMQPPESLFDLTASAAFKTAFTDTSLLPAPDNESVPMAPPIQLVPAMAFGECISAVTLPPKPFA